MNIQKLLKYRTRGYRRSTLGTEQGILKHEMSDMSCSKLCCKAGYRCEMCLQSELKYSKLQHAHCELKLSLSEHKLKMVLERSKGKKSEVGDILKDLQTSDGGEGTSNSGFDSVEMKNGEKSVMNSEGNPFRN